MKNVMVGCALLACALGVGCLAGGEPGAAATGGSSGGASSTSGGPKGPSSSSGASGSGSSGQSSGSSSGDSNDGGGGDRTPAKCATVQGVFGGLTMYECDPAGMEGKTGTPAPLVVAMHGYKQGAVEDPASGQPATPKWGLISTTEWAVLAERFHFYVVFPDTGFGAPSFDWYQSFSRRRGDFQADGIVSMVKAMQQKHDIDPNKIFVNGLSSGAFQAVVMLAEYPDVFAGGATFAGGAYGCDQNCAALGKKGSGWTWPGNHAPSLVTQAYPTVWNDPNARKPKLLIFQGDSDGAVTPENMADLVQQWAGALGIPATPANASVGAPTTLKGCQYNVYAKGSQIMLASILMPGIGHGTPVDPGTGDDQGGWDPMVSKQMANDANAVQDWTNSAGIYGPYYAAKFFGIVP